MKKLFYDVGGFDGTDTARYLNLGARVVTIEADPALAQKLTERFEKDIAKGDCTILNVAVAEKEGVLPFWICQENAALNSFDKASLDRHGLNATAIDVPCRPFQSILDEYGVPFFLKIDIEGNDKHCVLPLTKHSAPQFLSFEAGQNDLYLILHLHSIGFTKFNLIRQDVLQSYSPPRPGSLNHVKWSARQWARIWLRNHKGLHRVARKLAALKPAAPSEKLIGRSSGPTPMQTVDGWRSINEMVQDWSSLVYGGQIGTAWWDVHAKRDA